jgi:aconitate hydratase
VLRIEGLRDALHSGSRLIAHNQTQDVDVALCHRLSQRQVKAVLAGGVIPLLAE